MLMVVLVKSCGRILARRLPHWREIHPWHSRLLLVVLLLLPWLGLRCLGEVGGCVVRALHIVEEVPLVVCIGDEIPVLIPCLRCVCELDRWQGRVHACMQERAHRLLLGAQLLVLPLIGLVSRRVLGHLLIVEATCLICFGRHIFHRVVAGSAGFIGERVLCCEIIGVEVL